MENVKGRRSHRALACVVAGVIFWSVGFFGWLVWPQLLAFKWSTICYALGYLAFCASACCTSYGMPERDERTGGWI